MRPLDIFFAILVAAIWGCNFVAARFGMAHFPPFLLTAIRFALVSLVLLPFVPRPNKGQMWRIAQLALVLGVLHLALLFAALNLGLDIASCAIAAQLGVPFSCLLGAFILKDRLGPWRIAGMAVAFAGMVIVAGNPNILEHSLAFSVALAGAFFWGLSNIMIKQLEGVGNVQMLAWMALFSVPLLLLVSLAIEDRQWALLMSTTPSAALAVLYTAFGSTITAYGLWYYLLRKYPVSQVTPYTLLAPVFGIASGQLFFDEPLTWQVLLGGFITLAGVGVIVFRRPKIMAMGEAV